MAKSAAKVSLITALSRVLGYVRDAISAALLGVGPVSDAFFVAFRIPNMLRSLLAEGALSSAFVPVFTDYLIKKEKKDVWLLAANAMTALSVLLVAVTVVGVLFAGPIVRVMAPGFVNDPEKFSLTVSLTRALFPFILLVSVAALLMGILNSLKKFSMPAFAPVILNVSMILSGFFICPRLG
ncbi:MAG TPA: lipid II flippase MurJ, partial [Candidatus Goldiibacteriota bacterium]|nr:lipid II flippase MurJ [Candidatus Goldiibacteriota bacterium]